MTIIDNFATKLKMEKAKYTPLGDFFYSVEEWKRKKVFHELELAGIHYYTARTYFTRVAGFRVPADVQKIIMDTLPDAKDFFARPKPEKVSE